MKYNVPTTMSSHNALLKELSENIVEKLDKDNLISLLFEHFNNVEEMNKYIIDCVKREKENKLNSLINTDFTSNRHFHLITDLKELKPMKVIYLVDTTFDDKNIFFGQISGFSVTECITYRILTAGYNGVLSTISIYDDGHLEYSYNYVDLNPNGGDIYKTGVIESGKWAISTLKIE